MLRISRAILKSVTSVRCNEGNGDRNRGAYQDDCSARESNVRNPFRNSPRKTSHNSTKRRDNHRLWCLKRAKGLYSIIYNHSCSVQSEVGVLEGVVSLLSFTGRTKVQCRNSHLGHTLSMCGKPLYLLITRVIIILGQNNKTKKETRKMLTKHIRRTVTIAFEVIAP